MKQIKIQKNNKLMIFFSGLLLSLFFFALMHNWPIRGDSHSYDTIGWNLVKGNGFSQSKSSPFTPTMVREPGYPFFLALIYSIFGHSYKAVYLIQAILHAFTGIIVFYLVQKIFNRSVAYFSAWLTVLYPTLANYTSVLLSETLFTFWLTLSLLFITVASFHNKMVWYALSGLSFGITTLIKAVTLPLFILVIISWLFTTVNNKKTLFKNFVVATILFLLIPSSWIIRNYIIFKEPSITARAKASIYNRAVKTTYTAEQLKAYGLFCFSQTLARTFYPEYTTEEFFYKRVRELMSIKDKEDGSYSEELDNILGREAVDIVKQHPIRYIAFSGFELIKLFSFSHLPILGRFEATSITFLLLKAFLRLLGYIILIYAVIGMILHLKKWRNWFFISLTIFYIFGIYSLFDADSRYSVPLIPLLLIFASAVAFKRENKYITPS